MKHGMSASAADTNYKAIIVVHAIAGMARPTQQNLKSEAICLNKRRISIVPAEGLL